VSLLCDTQWGEKSTDCPEVEANSQLRKMNPVAISCCDITPCR
jgi:hypothetical protein